MKKHILCFGDSNTHGFCADPTDTADGGGRFTEEERWTCLLQNALGEAYLVIEEGLSGRTTVFDDPLEEGLRGLDDISGCMRTHKPIDLLVVMLGTNDTKERFAASAECISLGLERLIVKAKSVPVWSGAPNILIIAPPPMEEKMMGTYCGPTMGPGSVEKSQQLAYYYRGVAARQGCAFLDAAGIGTFNEVDCMHLTCQSHKKMADVLAKLIPTLV